MSFRLKKTTSLKRAVRRLARQHLAAAITHLRPAGPPAGIHCARKEIKKLRALFRLARAGIPRYHKTAQALCQTARLLAAPRDARVRLKAFTQLTQPATGKFPAIKRALRQSFRQKIRHGRAEAAMARAKKKLQKIDRRVANLKIKLAGWPEIAAGLQHSYERSRQAYRAARHRPTAEHFHLWRKQVKLFHYQLWLLGPQWPKPVCALMTDLAKVSDLLGADHDLYLLDQFVGQSRAGADAETKRLHYLIKSRQQKLRTAALKFGARRFATSRPAISAPPGDWAAH